MKLQARNMLIGLGGLVLFVAAVYLLSGRSPDPMVTLRLATGFTLLALIFLLSFAVLIAIANGDINLSQLLSETGSKSGASMSRFQLLIFTLVIALSLFLVTVSKMEFPAIPPEVLTLLGISASTYAVSKGITMSGDRGGTPPGPSPDATQQQAVAQAQAKATAAGAGAGGGNPQVGDKNAQQ